MKTRKLGLGTAGELRLHISQRDETHVWMRHKLSALDSLLPSDKLSLV